MCIRDSIDTATTGLKNIFHVSDFTRSAFSVALDALVQEGKARILSRPRLSCLSGKEAELLVGGEKPIMTTETVTGGGTSTNVEYKEYGIKLKIRPTAVEEEKIRLAVNIEVSEVGSAETLGTPQAPTARAYPLIKRSASTELLLNDGQTMAIGGLIKQKREEDIRKTPFLGDLPLVGALFRKKETKLGGGFGERGQTELFIALTPKIVTPRIEKEEVSKRIYVEPKVQINIPLNPISEYKWIIQNRIQENLIYPSLAKEAGWQGRVLLALKFSYQGTLLEAEIKSSSGYSILDQNALETAKKIKNFPPFPPAIKEEELYLEIPIVYKLE
ncbi:MAG: TonB family protein, partial [Candidatus Omnitrophica bacterium]|nr:TonB family protein [Candidatus Omnitrophota bacterium]